MKNWLFRSSFIRLLKKTILKPQGFRFHKKQYLFEKSLGKAPFISYVPDVFGIQITFRCNFRCPTCLFLLKDPQALDKGNDMSLEKFNWILEKFRGDIKMVGLSGGEPTLHPQFPEIVKSVKSRNLKLAMSTNGTLITKRLNDLKYFDKINVSLDGVDCQSFKKLRNGTEKQYNDIIEGIRLLRDTGIPFNLSFLLFEENLSEINKILAFAEEMRPRLLNLHSGNPHGSGGWTPLFINSPKVCSFLQEILKNNNHSFSIRLPIIFDPDSKNFKEQICPLLWSNVYIGWNGDMAYCCHLEPNPIIGNIFQDYNLNNPLMVQFRKAMMNHQYSKDCLYCRRRFVNVFPGYFDAKRKKWKLPSFYNKLKL